LQGRWLWNLDLLKVQYDALQKQCLFKFQQPYFEKYAPTFELNLVGGRGYSTIDPVNLEAVYSSMMQDWDIGVRREGLFPLVGEGIFCQDGDAWKHSRALLRKQFARLEYDDFEVWEPYVEALVDRLASTQGMADLQPAFFDFTLSTTTALLFGEPVDSLGKERRDEFSHHFDYGTYISMLRLRIADKCWLINTAAFRKSCNIVKKFAAHFVTQAVTCQADEGETRASEQYPFILDLHQSYGNEQLVRDQLVNVLLAGRDTTACSLSWAFFLLVRHPRVLQRLKEEVATVTKGETRIKKSHVRQMPYLKAVWDETLRLYPQIPVNVRVANKDTYLPRGGGPDGLSRLLVPKHTGVGVSVYHMHRSKTLFGEDADCFRPERWLTDELDKIGWGFMPFHNGPRICLGSKYNTIIIAQTSHHTMAADFR
jgi:cytochrome P450